MALGMEVGLGPDHIVLDGDPAPPPQNGAQPPIFGPFLLWLTAGWIKMPLGMEVGLRPGDFVLEWGPSSPLGTQLPLPSGWMDPNGTWHGGGPWPI